MKGNLGESWGKLLSNMFIVHKGYRAEKSDNQWIWRDKSFSTIEGFQSAVDEYILEAGEALGNSINRVK